MAPPNARTTAQGIEHLPKALPGRGPKSRQLRDVLERLLAVLSPGALLPSERMLAERYGIARMTVRIELDRLAREGLVTRTPGSGTYVAEPPLVLAGELRSFSEEMRARGMTPGSVVLEQEVVAAGPALAERLELPEGAPVVRIRRVRTADGAPLAIEEAHLPAERFPGLERADLSQASLFELTRRHGAAVERSEHRVLAVALGPDEAALLRVPSGQAGLLVRSVSRDAQEHVVQAVAAVYRGDRYEVLVRQRRDD